MQHLLLDELGAGLTILWRLIHFGWNNKCTLPKVHTDHFQNMLGELIHVFQDADLQYLKDLHLFRTTEYTKRCSINFHLI